MAKRRRRRQYHGIHAPVGGLKYALGTTVIGERNTPDCRNVRLTNGIISKNIGFRYFGSTSVTPLQGALMTLGVYHKAGATNKLMAVTDKNTYQYNTTAGRFTCVTYGEVVSDCETAWTDNANVTSTRDDTDKWVGTYSAKHVIAAVFTTGIAAFENFASDDFTAWTHVHFMVKCSVATTAGQLEIILGKANAGGTATENLDVPALTANEWAMVRVALVDPADLGAILSVALNVTGAFTPEVTVWLDDVKVTKEATGDEDNIVSMVNIPDGSSPPVDLIVWCNGLDTIKKWDLVTANAEELANATSYIPKWMLWFGQRLCLYDVIEATNRYRVRVRWSVAGDPEDWTGTGSGGEDLRTQVVDGDSLMRAERLGDYAIIYGKKSLAIQELRVGNVSSPFGFYPRISGIGLAAQQALVNFHGHEHIFLGWEDIYSFRGGRDAEAIGGDIVDELFNIINPSHIHKSFMELDEAEKVLRLHIPTGDSVRPNEYFELDLGTRAWSRGTRDITGSGWFDFVGGVTWDELTGTWDAQTANWDDMNLTTSFAVPVYGDTNGVVYTRDLASHDFAGVAVDAWWDTKDFTSGQDYKRETTSWMELNFDAKGDALDLYYSVDAGVSYRALPMDGSNTITLSSDWDRYEVHMEVYSPQIRFRFRNDTSEETFAVRWIEIGHIEKSDVETSEDT